MVEREGEEKREARLFPGFNLVLEIFVEGPEIPGQGVEVELLADTGKLRPVALGAGSGSLGVRSRRPLAVLLARILGRVLLEHNNVLVGDKLREERG